MKKIIISCVALACAILPGKAQDSNMFNHVAIGVTAGTPGFGADIALPVGNYVQLRAGFTMLPKISYSTDIDIDNSNIATQTLGIPNSVEVTGKLNFVNGKVLADIYPSKHSSFHFTAGAYIGKDEVVTVESEKGALNTLYVYNQNVGSATEKIGYAMGDYLLEPDKNGQIRASFKTAGFKPYVGLGFGRAVPKKRVGFMFELGAMYWNSPKVYCNDTQLTSENLGGEGEVLKTLSKISIYPVLNFRLCGRIF